MKFRIGDRVQIVMPYRGAKIGVLVKTKQGMAHVKFSEDDTSVFPINFIQKVSKKNT
jgi:hypothetical protein